MQQPVSNLSVKNRIIILITGILAILAVIAAVLIFHNKNDGNSASKDSGKSSQSLLGKEYKDTASGLRITPPAEWTEVKPTPSGDIVDFQDSKQDSDSAGSTRPVISVIRGRANGSLEQYAETISSLNAKNLQNYHEIKPHDITIDGQPAKVLNYTAKVSGHELRNSQLLIIKDGALYGFNGIALASAWDKHEAEISESFQSIKLP